MTKHQTNIRQAREARNIKTSEVVQKFGVSKAVVSAWETGKHLPSAETLIELADFYGVTLDFLLGRSKTIEAIRIQEEKTRKIDADFFNLLHGDPAFSVTRGWFLVNTIKNVAVFEDGSTVPLEEIDDAYMQSDIYRSKYGNKTIKMLTIEQIEKSEKIWVEPICQPDSPLKQIGGVYKVYADFGFVENEQGNRFMFCTYRGAWAAFHVSEIDERECQDFLDFYNEAYNEGYEDGKYEAEQALRECEYD